MAFSNFFEFLRRVNVIILSGPEVDVLTQELRGPLSRQRVLTYRSFGDTIPVPTIARVHFLSPKLWYRQVWATKLLLAAIGLVFPALVLGCKSFDLEEP